VPNFFSNILPKKSGNSYWYVFNSSAESFNKVSELDSYLDLPEVSAIINLKARAFSNMRLIEVGPDGKPKETSEGKALLELLTNPNWFQAGKEFLIQTKTYREIYVNEYLFSQVPFGFKKDRTKSIFTLPPNIVKAEFTDSTPFYLIDKNPKIEYSIKIDDQKYAKLSTDQVIHMNDNRVSMKSATDEDILKGESKLKALSVTLNNMKHAYESRGIVLKYRGANGAWVNKSKDAIGQSFPLNSEDKERLQDANRKYGTLGKQNQTIVTDQDIAWVQAGTNNPMNLGLFEENKEGFNKCLDSFGVPSEMFARVLGATYENQRQAEKGLYVRTIIPEANDWASAVSSEYLPGTKLIADYSHLPVFQEDLKSRADSLNSMVTALSKMLQDGAITIAEYQSEISKYGIIKV